MKRKELLAAIAGVFALVIMVACDHGGKLPPAPGEEPPEPEFVFQPQEEIPWRGLASSPWPMYLHDPQHTGRSPYSGPDSGVVVWAVDLTPEEIHSSPAIGEDGTIYVTTHQPGNSLVAISPQGVVEWRFQTGGSVDSSPLVGADGTIYFGSEDGRLYAVNPDGSLKWTFSVGGGMGFGLSSPNISRDGQTVFIRAGSVEKSRVYAIRADTGQEVWRFDAPAGRLKGLSPYSPALSPNANVLYAPGWDAVYAIRTEDGRLVWRVDLDGQAASPSVDNQGRIYVNTEFSTYALTSDGTLAWKVPKPGSTTPEYTSVSIGRRGMLYRSTVLPIVQGLDYAGQLIWEVNLRDFAGMFVGTEYPPISDNSGHVYVAAAIPGNQQSPNFFALSDLGQVKFKLMLANPATGVTGSVAVPALGKGGDIYAVSHGAAVFCVR